MEKHEKQRLGVGFLGAVIGGFYGYHASNVDPSSGFLGGALVGLLIALIAAVLIIRPPEG